MVMMTSDFRAERLKAYAEKTSKNPALIAKTSVLFDVKPWDDETDMNEMLKNCKSIEKEGLVWGACELFLSVCPYKVPKVYVVCVIFKTSKKERSKAWKRVGYLYKPYF